MIEERFYFFICTSIFLPVTSFSYVLLRLSIVLHDGLAAPVQLAAAWLFWTARTSCRTLQR